MRSSKTAVVVAMAAGSLLAGTVVGCGGGDDGQAVASLTAQVRNLSAQVEENGRKVRDLEARNRVLEEQIAAVKAGPATAAPGAPAPAEAADGDGEAVPPGDASEGASSMAAFLETTEGREKLRSFLEEEKKREEAKQREERREQFRRMITDRVNGPLAEQLNLTETQKATVIDVFTDTMEKMGEMWREARDSGDSGGFATVREKMGEIRQQAETQLQQALTVDQFEKLQEMSGPGGNFLGFGGRGGGFGGPRGGGAGGR